MMTIQIELPQDLEKQLRNLNQDSTSAMHSFILEALKSRLLQQPADEVAQEAALLAQINIGFSEEFWQKYHILTEKKSLETIDNQEYDELIAMDQKIEAANARRLEAAYQLALLRKKDPKQLMKELGIFKDVFTA